ncbi:MAG: 50S ribosomal protein L10 [candidate division WOR-3 bacterium]
MTKSKLKRAAREPLVREPRPEKVKAVEELRESLETASAFYLADFRGIDVGSFTRLRRQLRDVNSGVRVVKNNLLRRALAQMNMDEMASGIDGQNAVIYAKGDEIAPVRIFYDFAKEHGVGVLKLGFLAGRVIGKDEIEAISRLPSPQELRARVVGILQAQLAGPVYVMKALLLKLVYALNAIRELKEKGEKKEALDA